MPSTASTHGMDAGLCRQGNAEAAQHADHCSAKRDTRAHRNGDASLAEASLALLCLTGLRHDASTCSKPEAVPGTQSALLTFSCVAYKDGMMQWRSSIVGLPVSGSAVSVFSK